MSAPMLESANAFVNSAGEEHHHQVVAHRRHRRRHALDGFAVRAHRAGHDGRRRATGAAARSNSSGVRPRISGAPAPVSDPSGARNGEAAGHAAQAMPAGHGQAQPTARPTTRDVRRAVSGGADGIRAGSPSTAIARHARRDRPIDHPPRGRHGGHGGRRREPVVVQRRHRDRSAPAAARRLP